MASSKKSSGSHGSLTAASLRLARLLRLRLRLRLPVLLLLLVPFASISLVKAFTGPYRYCPTTTAPYRFAGFVQATGSDIEAESNTDVQAHADGGFQTDRESIQRDIADLQLKASQRLDALLGQMEDLHKLNESKNLRSSTSSNGKVTNQQSDSNSNLLATSTKVAESVESTGTGSIDHVPSGDSKHISTTGSESHASKANAPKVGQHKMTSMSPMAVARTEGSLDLLNSTVWKVVVSIGREAGTWMPKDWAASGDRLYCHYTLQFTDQKLPMASSGDDTFFQSSAASNGSPKVLKVVDAFIMPCPGARDNREGKPTSGVFLGRRPLPVLPTGAYKVCRGQGPAGTDILRFYVQLTESIDNYNDVSCSKGRIYGTCGYFPSVTTDRNESPVTRVRDICQQNHDEALREYAARQEAVESDVHAVWHPDHWRLVQATWLAKEDTQTTAAKLQAARLREPERSKLRFTPKGDVALTAEGGVCVKVHQGLALEYHILGRLQVACIAQDVSQTKEGTATEVK